MPSLPMYAAYTQGMQMHHRHALEDKHKLEAEQTRWRLNCVAKLVTFHDEVRMGLVLASDHLHTVQPNIQSQTCVLCLLPASRSM